jgi:hypothetical protein
MCRMSRHTTLLLIGIWNSKKFLAKNPFDITRLQFTGAEKIAKLAWNFCSIPWVKPLSTFAIMEEGYLIYNFAVQWKAWFSFKFGETRVWKLYQWIEICWERRSTLYCDVERGHVGKPPYAPYPRRARTPRRWSNHWSLAVTARAPPWRPWQVDRARWRQSAGRCTARGAPLAAGAAHVAGHVVTPPRVHVSQAWPH